MASAWSKPPNLTVTVAAPPTEADLAAAAKKRADAAAAALQRRAEELVRLIDASYKSRGGGVSGKYGMDEQYQVGGSWSDVESNLAKTLWIDKHRTTVSNIFRTARQQKMSGGRDGKWQWNFIRDIAAPTRGRFNIHVNWNGK